ncbi:MAG: hypothetical protein Q8O89_03180 [Nanoarchaeota archaeon]|nr:hypothetical protein [Nanoarchaeota archaeon]
MLQNISYYMIFGFPLLAYVGGLAFISLLTTAAISIMNKKGIKTIPFKYHPIMAGVTMFFAIIHVLMVILAKI